MTKEELYNISDGDLGSTVAAGLKANFEGIIDDAAALSTTVSGVKAASEDNAADISSLKESTGDVSSILQRINNETL